MMTLSYSRLSAAIALSGLCAALMPLTGQASTVTLTNGESMSFTEQFLNTGVDTAGNDYVLTLPGNYTYNDTLAPESGTALGTSSVGPYDFQDSYRFQIGSQASGDVVTVSLSQSPQFNINNLQFRLYEVEPPNSNSPVVGSVPSGDKVITAWQGPTAGSDQVSATFSGLGPGTYIMDVAGTANGAVSGTYIGDLNLVPLPAALPLLLSGLGGLGALFGRRRTATTVKL